MQNPKRHVRALYKEQLTPSLWAMLAAAVAGPMVALTFTPVNAAVAMILGLVATVLIIGSFILLAPRVQVQDRELRAGRARIDAAWLGEPRIFTGDEARHARGPGLSARGWHLIRGGIDGIVVVPNIDPQDPVNVWTISSRTPDRLAAAINAAREIASANEGSHGRAKADSSNPGTD